ncbi:hypothetical protein DdX_06697 [Ditylenchus destructor]|uniref:Uncharacterized protein n=1 Tax=Ditylenchus destructor TaxID=166010 RepID=A0AAD4N7L7_9BILA|nr:hypothetical protein DdX_06697 [Ditylenchus destructor]
MASMRVDIAKYFCNGNFAKEMLGDSIITSGFIVEKLLDSHEEFRETMERSKIKTISAKDICGTNGYTSQIYLVSLELVQESGKSIPSISVVMKAFSPQRVEVIFNNFVEGKDETGMKSHIEKMKNQMCVVHNTECDFYSQFRNVPKEIMPIPNIYYIQKCDLEIETPGIIIMGDLTESSCIAPIYEGLSVDQVNLCFCCLKNNIK